MKPFAWVGQLFARLTGVERVNGRRRYFGHKVPAGVYVDAENALKNATVWACVQYLASTVAQLPWRVMQEQANGGAVVYLSSPVDWLLHKRPNPEMGSFSFRQT
jgi:phage portal protein BeeE